MGSDSNAQNYGIETLQIRTATGVTLSLQQKLLVGCVLDLFKGKVTLEKLQLWTDEATFNDPLTKSKGRRQYQAQWYGLKSAFSEIQQIHAIVVSSENPIIIDMKTRYKVKLIGKEQIICSEVKVFTNAESTKIVGVDDGWNGKIPVGAFSNAFRYLNSIIVPALVRVPKSGADEHAKKGE